MKNPYQLIREIEFNTLDNQEKNTQKNISYIENFIIWIVGFSVTAIGLIISNFEKLKLIIPSQNIQIILGFLVCSLFFGIFNRYSIFCFSINLQRIQQYIKISLSDFDFPELEPDNLSDNITFVELIDKFKLDYDLDYSRYYEEFHQLNTLEREKFINNLKLRYFEVGKFLNEAYNEGLEDVRNVYKDAYGFSEKKSKKLYYMDHSKIASRFKLWTKLVDLTFILCCLLFFIGILILVISTF